MFYVIKDEKMFEFGDKINKGWECPDEAQEIQGVTLFDYQTYPDKYIIENGKLIDISQTAEYLAKIAEEEKNLRKEEIEAKLNELDIKCIRALREGGNDDEGTPFIEKYQTEILALRDEYNSL